MSNTKGEVYPKKLLLSISGKEGRIRIGWGVADALHGAEYLCIYMSPDDDAIMVKPCEQKEFVSIKVGNRKEGTAPREMLIYSLAFVTDLMERQGWDYMKSYSIVGEYIAEYNAVVFFLKNAIKN